MEMGFPVAHEIQVEGELYMSKTYAGKAVTGIHKGSYSKLDPAYGEILRFIEENSLELAGTYYDHYLNDPDKVSEDELLTKIVIPVK